MLKKLATVSLSLALICSSTVSFAGDSLLSQGTIVTPLKIEETISPRVVTLFYEFDEDFSYETKGSSFRVSDSIKTGAEGGSISVSKGKTTRISWGASLNKDMKHAINAGVSFSINKSISTKVGYTLNVGANQKTYIKATPVYKVSVGTLKTYRGQKLLEVETVSIKSPSHYEYELD